MRNHRHPLIITTTPKENIPIDILQLSDNVFTLDNDGTFICVKNRSGRFDQNRKYSTFSILSEMDRMVK